MLKKESLDITLCKEKGTGMRSVRWVKAILIIFLALFINGNVWAEEKEITKFKNGISHFDLNGDGIKDIVMVGEYLTPFGGNIYKAYSFYLKTKTNKLFYVPIQEDKGSGAVIYTFSKVGGCGSTFNKEEITNISGLRIIKLGNDIYLVFVEKDCGKIEKLINDKCVFKINIYSYDAEENAFLKYKITKTSNSYCDAEQVFLDKAQDLLNLIRGGNR